MEVNDVRKRPEVQSKVGSLQRDSKSLATDVFSVSAESGPNNFNEISQKGGSQEVRGRLNQVISAVNVASEATFQIEKLVKSVSGIVAQVSPETPPQRKQILEREANQLVAAIKERAQSATDDGKKPLAGDSISIKEKAFEQSLEVILPDDASKGFGISPVSFSHKDAILQTRDSITRAEQRLEELRGQVKNATKLVKDTVTKAEVALENQEASRVSLRDLDVALEVASKTSLRIEKDPDTAINSFGQFSSKALELLKS